MHVKQIGVSGLALAVISALAGPGAGAGEASLLLGVPKALEKTGLVRYLLPRFHFKFRIKVVAVPAGAPADMVLTGETGGAARRDVFVAKAAGTRFALAITAPQGPRRKAAAKFRDWLLSKPGRAAIAAYPPGKPPLFKAAPKAVRVVAMAALTGDAKHGHQLASQHCSRCHVVDKKRPFSGIGSSPSFSGLRTRPDWRGVFRTFWSVSPHASVISVKGMSERKSPAAASNIVPIQLTPEDVNDILAYVATIKPKDLGAPIALR